jgi:hypothetical protein
MVDKAMNSFAVHSRFVKFVATMAVDCRQAEWITVKIDIAEDILFITYRQGILLLWHNVVHAKTRFWNSENQKGEK